MLLNYRICFKNNTWDITFCNTFNFSKNLLFTKVFYGTQQKTRTKDDNKNPCPSFGGRPHFKSLTSISPSVSPNREGDCCPCQRHGEGGKRCWRHRESVLSMLPAKGEIDDDGGATGRSLSMPPAEGGIAANVGATRRALSMPPAEVGINVDGGGTRRGRCWCRQHDEGSL